MKRYRRSAILEGAATTSALNRAMAKTIDCVVLAAAFYLVSWLSPLLGWAATLTLAAFGDALGNGQSVGKRILGLRVSDEPTGLPCTLYQSAIRNLPLVLGILISTFAWFKTLGVAVAAVLAGFELYLMLMLPTGVRLGDVYANTQVLEVNPDEAMLL